MDTAAAVLVLVLALIGCVRCVEWAVMWLTRDVRGVWLVPVSAGADVEYVAWCAAARGRWKMGRRERLYLVDMGLDAAGREVAERLGLEVVPDGEWKMESGA